MQDSTEQVVTALTALGAKVEEAIREAGPTVWDAMLRRTVWQGWAEFVFPLLLAVLAVIVQRVLRGYEDRASDEVRGYDSVSPKGFCSNIRFLVTALLALCAAGAFSFAVVNADRITVPEYHAIHELLSTLK